MSDINVLIDRAKILTYSTKYSAFLAPILCKLEVKVSDSTQTAGTDGKTLYINKDFFESLSNTQRVTLILHEVWHVARLHMLRRDNRDPRLWNIACDISINNDLVNEGRDIESLNGIVEYSLQDKSEEEIYDYIKNNPHYMNIKTGGNGSYGLEGDIKENNLSNEDKAEITANVVTASQLATMSGCEELPGNIKQMLDKFLKPELPWEKLLEKYFTDLSKEDYSWKKPNRRFTDIYLPSLEDSENKLDHIAFFMDTSGSISDEQLLRFNSEVKHIQNTFKPKKLTVIQFDFYIHKIDEYTPEDSYKAIEVVGRGGTDLEDVYKYILNHNLTAAVIFTDLECRMMPKVKTPLIWVISDNPNKNAPFGKNIHI